MFAKGFMMGYLTTMFEVAEWALKHPRAYVMTALPLFVATMIIGASYGDWSAIGVFKFWLASTMFSLICSTPTFLLAKELTY